MSPSITEVVLDHLQGRATGEGHAPTQGDPVSSLKNLQLTTSAVEMAMRRILFDVAERQDSSIENLKILLELVLDCSDEGLCGPDLPLSMLEEIMDILTIAGCDQMFDFLERNRQRMTVHMGKGQTLLRLCNELLRRLSKTEDTVFCGRILIFLSLVFPLSERSAVNLRGEYNTDNITTFEEAQKGESQGSSGDHGAMTSSNIPPILPPVGEDLGALSNSIYETFWSLQTYFNNPMLLLTGPAILAKFHKSLGAVLDVLENIQRNASKQERSEPDHPPSSENLSPQEVSEVRAFFTPKFLTSRKLLSLELSELSFRRQICVQILIVLDFLLSLSTESKEKWNKKVVTTNKSLQIGYLLPIADSDWILQTRLKIAALIESGSSGAHYLHIIETVLRRDQDWLRWKCTGCAPYELPSIEQKKVDIAPQKITGLITLKRRYPHLVGNAVLSKLWAATDGDLKTESLTCSE